MLTFEHTIPTLLIWLAVLGTLTLVVLSFRRSFEPSPANITLFVLRILFLLLLYWCLFMPQKQHAVTRRILPRFLLALDTSGSMSLSSAPGVADRWSVAQEVLGGEWRDALKGRCRIDAFTFSTRMGPRTGVDEAASANPDAPATALRDSLEKLTEQYRGQEVAALLLLSDGIDTREPMDKWANRQWDWPIYTLCHEPPPPKKAKAEPDLRIDSAKTTKRVTVGWKTELKAVVSGEGTGGKPANIQLTRNGKLIEETATWIPDQGGSKELAFSLNHPETGVFVYRVLAPPFPGESRTNDNSRTLSVQVVDTRNRLLYVEGPPRWESKFLLRTLKANSQVTPICFIRGHDGKFMALGRHGDVTPDVTAEQLALVKIVIVGNLDAEELGDTRARNLLEFVDAGGSLVLLGGARAWSESGFPKTPLRKLLPVSPPIGKPRGGTFTAGLTESGRSHPAFAGDPALWETVPHVLSVFPVGQLPPGADALVTARGPEGDATVVAVQRYGQGKVVAILTDSLYRWKLDPDESGSKPYQRFWDQLLAWLSPSEKQLSPETIDIFADTDQLHLGEEIEISARTGKRDGAAAKPGVMRCEITTPDKRKVPFTMAARHVITPTGKTFPGYGIKFTAEQPGLHTAVATIERGGRTIKSDPLSFFVKAFTAEKVPRPANVKVLRALAERSGGRFFKDPKRLDKALSGLSIKAKEETRITHSSLWQSPFVISCLVILLAVEWIVRKWRNMA